MPVYSDPDKIEAPVGSAPASGIARYFQRMAETMQAAVTALRTEVKAAAKAAGDAATTAAAALERPAVKAYVNSPILTSGPRGSIPLTNTVIRYPTESRDPNRPQLLIATKPGVYLVGGGAGWAAVPSASGGSTGPRIAQIRINADGAPGGGTAVHVEKRIDPNGATYAPFLPLPYEQVRLSAGDRVELFVQHGQGSGVNVTEATYLELIWVRPL